MRTTLLILLGLRVLGYMDWSHPQVERSVIGFAIVLVIWIWLRRRGARHAQVHD
jgi:hypothetical protein